MTEHEQALLNWAKRRKRVVAMREKDKNGTPKFKVREIAEREGISVGRVQQILQREKSNGKEH